MEKLIQIKIEDGKSMLRKVIGEMPMAGVILDSSGIIEYCNDSLLEMTGWSEREVVGTCWFETFVPAGQRMERKSEYQKAMMSGVPRSRHRSEILSRDGREIGILWNGTVLRDDKGDVSGFVKLGLNLEEIPRPYDREPDFRKYETIGRAAAGLAHDLNNLFFPILGYADMILVQALQGSELHNCAMHIRLAGKRGTLLAGQMLSAIRRRDEPVKLEELDIAGVVVEFGELIRSMLGGNIALNIDTEGCTFSILATGAA